MNADTPISRPTATATPLSVSDLTVRNQLDETRELLWEVCQATHAASQGELHELASLLLTLVDLLQQWQAEPSRRADDAEPLSRFVDECLPVIRASAAGQPSSSDNLGRLVQQVRSQWGDLLPDADTDGRFDDDAIQPWDQVADPPQTGDAADGAGDDPFRVPSDEEISKILMQLTETPTAATSGDAVGRPSQPRVAPQEEEVELNDELREAFMDDATRCIGAIEAALLAYEAQPKDRRPLQQICRELHTLKGASGSVGLSDLADYLHGIEDRLRDACENGGNPPSVELLFQNVDSIRNRIARIQSPSQPAATDSAPAGAVAEPAAAAPVPSFTLGAEGAADEESLRVKPSQLNRLMDMLAELVMLRNRRDCELTELKEIHSELLHSVSRLRVFSDRCEGLDGPSAPTLGRPLAEDDRSLPRLSEVAADVLEAAQRLRASYQPVAEGNEAVSQFIRQFRQELVSLRRMPVSGLFRRLQRVASDAARGEGKQVRLDLLGEDAGIERSLQQRLYEPLLHIIRNAVSHGIEHQEQRVRQGKSPVGRITLEARTGPDLLVIEIRDDGRGLDYDALRRRGLELGLLTAHTAAHQDELSQLIFHPGFSTRQEANQVAGRGVGMDVVASTIQRMRGWVEVDSVTGQGTTFRLTFPLPSVIQHTMVFRSGGQIFALPMQFVQTAGDVDGDLPTLKFCEGLGPSAAEPGVPRQSLVVGCDRSAADHPQASGKRFRLLIDQILGPEEVVVRPLPALLKHHPFCSGATLSGTGEVVLVLDNHRFVEWATAAAADTSAAADDALARHPSAPAAPPRALVVDDSLSARKRIVRCLRRWNIETAEAADGQEACELLRKESFDAVFSDLEMPRLDGLGLLEEIGAGRCGPVLPVVIVSSRTEQSLRDRAKALGVSGYLSKPVSEAAVLSALRNIPSLCSVTHAPHVGQ